MEPQSRPVTIQIFLPFGDPRGIRVAELTTRIVRVVEVPREHLDQFVRMTESEQVGIYFLFGQESETGTNLLYVGHTGATGGRLKEHREKKLFWTRALIAVTLTNTLTQTHTQYLEWRAIAEAKRIGRYTLDNQNAGSKPYTPAPLEADCHEIFETISTLVATLGFPVFEPLKRIDTLALRQDLLFCRASEADGRGYYSDDGFVVLKGSSGRRENVPSIRGTSDERFRDRLIRDGVLRVEGDRIVFERDHLFPAPSSAAIALTGRTANGWLEWKNAEGKSLKELRTTAETELF